MAIWELLLTAVALSTTTLSCDRLEPPSSRGSSVLMRRIWLAGMTPVWSEAPAML